MQKKEVTEIAEEAVMNRIFYVRGHKVMLDKDLADLYNVETRRLNEQVRRNPGRFPPDFMFQLTRQEHENLMSQNATSSWGGSRKLPLAFTEQGVAMLASVLTSEKAIQVNILIVRVFTRIRQVLLNNEDLKRAIGELARRTDGNSKDIRLLYRYLERMNETTKKPRKAVGYKLSGKAK